MYTYIRLHVIYDTRVHDVTGETTAGKREQKQKEEKRERETEKTHRERSGYRWMGKAVGGRVWWRRTRQLITGDWQTEN